jgi:hypothetical protein
MDSIIQIISVWYPVIASVIGTFALIATLTPNKVDNKIAQVLMEVVNFLGANLGKAKNDPN